MNFTRLQNSTAHPISFYAVLASDHVTPATGKTFVLKAAKDATGTGASVSGAVTELDATNLPGWYAWAGNSTDRNTVGDLVVTGTATGCDNVDFRVVIEPWDPFNALGIPADVKAVVASSTDATALGSLLGTYSALGYVIANVTGGNPLLYTLVGDSAAVGAVAPDGSALAKGSDVPSAATIATAVWDTLTSVARTAGSYGAKLKAWVLGSDSKAMISTDAGAVPATVATATSQTSILNAVNAITTNTARGKLVLPYWLVRPTSGSVAYEIDLNLYSLQGQLEVPDAAPTIHARNSAGTSLDAGLSATTMTLVSTGKYKVTYTVASTDTAQEVLFDATWAVGAVNFAVSDATEVQDAEQTATLTAILAQANKIGTNGGDSPNAVTGQTTIATNLNATVASRAQPADVPSASANATAAAAAVLVTPGNKLATNGSGFVTATNGGGSGGGLSGPSSVTLIFHDASNAAVPLVQFTVQGQGAGRANSSGAATFGLPDGTYTVTAQITNGVVFADTTLTVTGTTTLTITGSNQTLSPPTTPGTQRVTCNCITPTGQANPNEIVEFQLTKTNAATGIVVPGTWQQSSPADSNGQTTIDLVAGYTYLIRAEKGSAQPYTPEATGAALLPFDVVGKANS